MTDNDIKQMLITKVTEAWELLNDKWCGRLEDKYDFPSIRFDVRGKLAGQAIVSIYTRETEIRFNLSIARDNLETFLERTPAHEVAHIANKCAGGKGHDRMWKSIMQQLGVTPSRCHSYNIPLQTGEGLYECDNCGHEHKLSKLKHKRQQLDGRYVCKCNGKLILK